MTLPHPTIIIPARSGSKRLPGKNLMVLGGKTLLQRCIDTAVAVVEKCGGGNVFVIVDQAFPVQAYSTTGPEVYITRPDSLAGDDVSTEVVVRWFINRVMPSDPLVLMQCTSPFTTVEHVLICIWRWKSEGSQRIVFSMKDTPQGDKCRLRPSGQVYVFSRAVADQPNFFSPAEYQFVEYVAVPSERRAIDIDTKEDFDDAIKIEQEKPIVVTNVSTQRIITLHLRSTDRADRGHLYPLYEAACKDKRFLPLFSEPGDTKPVRFDEVIFLQGDRTELLYEAAMAVQVGAIIAHAAGGERTKGSTDDCTRDAITKLAHLHYPVHQRAANRIHAELSEEIWRICVAGEIGVDDIKSKPLMSWRELEAKWPDTFKMAPGRNCTIYAIHPVTNNPGETSMLLNRRWLDGFDQIYLSQPNSDPGHERIIDMFMHWGEEYRGKYIVLPNLGAHAFRSLMKLCGTIIGNSSALITEAPHLGCLPILVGTRQEGRFPSESDGNACGRILDHLYHAVTSRGDSIRTKT